VVVGASRTVNMDSAAAAARVTGRGEAQDRFSLEDHRWFVIFVVG
jgi:hypothetical protein